MQPPSLSIELGIELSGRLICGIRRGGLWDSRQVWGLCILRKDGPLGLGTGATARRNGAMVVARILVVEERGQRRRRRRSGHESPQANGRLLSIEDVAGKVLRRRVRWL